jgi:glycosyltransferase involved in cell wall biosynthesis
MSSLPLISIILPTYDRLRYLPTAIESVVAQTIKNWELIIADDGSGVDVRTYLATLTTHDRIKVILLPHLGNPGAARNVALRQAQGTYVAFLDSDDLWMPTKLEMQLRVLESQPERQWSYTDFVRVDHSGASIDFERAQPRIPYQGQIFEPLLRLRAGIAMPTVMATRALLARAGGFDEGFQLHEDYELWLRLALLSQVSRLAEPLACVRRHAEHFSSGGISSLRARGQVLEKMRNLLTDTQQLAILRAERVRNDVALAIADAVASNKALALSALTRAWPYSWRDSAWYLGCAKVLAHLVLPAGALALARRLRSSVGRRC